MEYDAHKMAKLERGTISQSFINHAKQNVPEFNKHSFVAASTLAGIIEGNENFYLFNVGDSIAMVVDADGVDSICQIQVNEKEMLLSAIGLQFNHNVNNQQYTLIPISELNVNIVPKHVRKQRMLILASDGFLRPQPNKTPMKRRIEFGEILVKKSTNPDIIIDQAINYGNVADLELKKLGQRPDDKTIVVIENLPSVDISKVLDQDKIE